MSHFSEQAFDINVQLSGGQTLAHKAAAEEDIGALVSLLECNFSLINAVDKENNTPLSLAILHEKFFSSKTLISNGADVNLGGGHYGSCLNITTIKYQIYLAQDLLSRGADPNQADGDGNTALHYLMTFYGRDTKYSEKIIQLLLRAGADPNRRNRERWTPLHLAVRKEQQQAVDFIVRHNKSVAKLNN